MVMAQKRHGMRPAHIHFLISAPNYRELVTALYLAGDEHLEDDVVFGASGDLVAELEPADPASPVPGLPSIHFDFTLSRETEADRRAGRVGGDPSCHDCRQRQGNRPLRRTATGGAGRRAAEEAGLPGRPLPRKVKRGRRKVPDPAGLAPPTLTATQRLSGPTER